jgi:hypothetical protein
MKPSKTAEPKIHYSRLLPPKGFCAITLFGHVFIRKEYEKMGAWAFNELLYHETIHIKQAIVEHDSWFVFYMKYLGYWIRNMFHCKFKNDIAYHCIPYEMEAYYQEIFWRLDKHYQCHNLQKFKDFPYKKAILMYQKGEEWHNALARML